MCKLYGELCPFFSQGVTPGLTIKKYFTTPPELFRGFDKTRYKGKITICRCAYYKGNPVQSL
jgi:hypothetical protein